MTFVGSVCDSVGSVCDSVGSVCDSAESICDSDGYVCDSGWSLWQRMVSVTEDDLSLIMGTLSDREGSVHDSGDYAPDSETKTYI